MSTICPQNNNLYNIINTINTINIKSTVIRRTTERYYVSVSVEEPLILPIML